MESCRGSKECSSKTAAAKKFSAAFIGRFDFSDPRGPVFGWPGSSIKVRFSGTGLKMIMRPINPAENGNWFNIIIDDNEPVKLHVDAERTYTLASGLPDEEHEITIWKRTGAANGELQLLELIPDEGGTLLPPPPRSERRIEFIGDSMTCGYGNEAANPQEGYKSSQENNYLAFGSVAARELGAEHISIAWGGRGVYRNYGGETHDTIPDYYPRTLPKNEDKLWDFKSWIPHAVVINLGTNDFAHPGLDTEAFVKTYSRFIKFIRGNYSDAHIFCAAGPMDHRAKDYLINIVDEMNKQGDKKIHYIEFPIMNGKTEGVGGDWHPTVKTHLRVGMQLAEEIKAKLGW
jgi:lysophospholipase L1-like esterase